MKPQEDIEFIARGPVAVLTLNRPQRLNAFREQTFREFGELLDQLASDRSIRVVVITGTGRAFSAGKDLKEVEPDANAPDAMAGHRAELERLQDITRKMQSYPKVLIAAVNGVAVGFGAELLLCCDLRLASEGASFAFVEPKRGLFPTNGTHFLLPRLIGPGRAAEMLLSGNRVSAAEAVEWGLVNHVVPDDKLMEAALGMADTIAANAPLSVGQSLSLLRQVDQLTLEEVLLREVSSMMKCWESPDVLEGTRAFFEKRRPVFTSELSTGK